MADGGENLPTPPNEGASKYDSAEAANDAAIAAAKRWLKEYVKNRDILVKKVEEILDTKFKTLPSENKACDTDNPDLIRCPKHTVMIVGEFGDLTDPRKPFSLKVTFDVDIKPKENTKGKNPKGNKPKNPKTKGTEPEDNKDHKQAPHIGWEIVKNNERAVRVEPKARRGNPSPTDKRLLNDDTGHCYIMDKYRGSRRPPPHERKRTEAGNAPEGEGVGLEKVEEPLDLGQPGLTLTFYKLKGLCVEFDGLGQ